MEIAGSTTIMGLIHAVSSTKGWSFPLSGMLKASAWLKRKSRCRPAVNARENKLTIDEMTGGTLPTQTEASWFLIATPFPESSPKCITRYAQYCGTSCSY